MLTEDDYELIRRKHLSDVPYRPYTDMPGTGPCPADLDDDGDVDAADLAELLLAWGANPDHPADFNHDGQVEAADLAESLLAWGVCE